MTAATLDRARALLDRPAPEVPVGQLTLPDGPRIGSLCTGYGGLDMAITQVLGGSLAWVADPDPGAAAILAHHHPTVPNLGDITAVDWRPVQPVDFLVGGYPCQPFSVAGLRKGTSDERHIWPFIATALRVLRPRLALFENVAGHLRLGFDTVLADLAALGFDAEWCLVRASEVGAPHRRERLWIVAWPADAEGPRLSWAGVRGRSAERGNVAAADAADLGHERVGGAWGGRSGPADGRDVAADSDRGGLPGHSKLPAERDAVRVGLRDDADGQRPPAAPHPDGRGRRPLLDELRQGEPDSAWGHYAPAVARWEAATGRPAPWATDARGRLNPQFVEWLMGLPAGHVTAVPGLTRTQQLKALGNGVVPRQAEAALRLLLGRAGVPR